MLKAVNPARLVGSPEAAKRNVRTLAKHHRFESEIDSERLCTMMNARLATCRRFGSLVRQRRYHMGSLSRLEKQERTSFLVPFALASTCLLLCSQPSTRLEEPSSTTILNWSGTHAVDVASTDYYEPESIEEVEWIVKTRHVQGKKLRPIGSALSPNGIAFQKDGMMAMSGLDRIVKVDPEAMTVTVEAGARVSHVIEALRPYNLTLPNLASIAEQQFGGFVQVGAHGTGREIAPVDHYVTALKLVTPGQGTVTLTEANGDLFHMAKVGLGCIGVVVEVTMKCIPAHRLVEHTFVLTRAEAKEQLNDLLRKHKHMRYMWIPYADAVVVVTNDPEGTVEVPEEQSKLSEEERFRPLTDLLLDVTKNSSSPFTKESLAGMGFGEIRDALLAVNPLDMDHVKRCNQAEAEFWRRSAGYQIKPSDELLQFDCGGQVRCLPQY